MSSPPCMTTARQAIVPGSNGHGRPCTKTSWAYPATPWRRRVDARLEERRTGRRVAEVRGVGRRPLERVVREQPGAVGAVVLGGPRRGVRLGGAAHHRDLVRVVALPRRRPTHVRHAREDAAAEHAVGEEGGTGDGVGTARREADHGEAFDAEVVGEGGDVARGSWSIVRPGCGARCAVAGAIERHHPHSLVPGRSLDRAHVEPAARGAVEVHDHRAVVAAAIGEPELPTVGKRHRCIAHGLTVPAGSAPDGSDQRRHPGHRQQHRARGRGSAAGRGGGAGRCRRRRPGPGRGR